MLRAVRRNTELGLIVLGTLITVGAYLLASLAEDATIPANIGPFLAVVLGLQLAAHVAIRRLAPDEIGRPSCGERVCQYVSISVVAESFKTENIPQTLPPSTQTNPLTHAPH